MNDCDHSGKIVYKILDLDVEAECLNGKNCCGPQRKIVLFKHDDAPEFLRGNPFVVNGYRSTLSFTLCLKSLFTWNNDTVNIWTHLIGFFIFFFLMIQDSVVYLYEGVAIQYLDWAVLSTSLFCCQFCLLASTGYHIFRCHSSKAYHRWLSLDLTGILIGLLGCYLPGIHFAFYCFTIWRDIYLFIIGVLFIAVFYYQTTSRYSSPRWFQARLLLYVSLAASGVIPTFHWIYVNGGMDSEIVQTFRHKVIVVYLLGAAAFGFFITQFPERIFPGKFDFIGSSHQLWHVIVVLLFLWWHNSGEELIRYWGNHPCQG